MQTPVYYNYWSPIKLLFIVIIGTPVYYNYWSPLFIIIIGVLSDSCLL